MTGRTIEIRDLVSYASQLISEDGVAYYTLPYWFRKVGDREVEVYFHDLPEDLQQAITKARMGGSNVKIMKPEELCG